MKLADAIRDVKTRIKNCSICSNLTEDDPCAICLDTRRDQTVVCIVEQPKDLLSLEATGLYRGELEKKDLYVIYFYFTPKALVRKMKDSVGDNHWQPSTTPGVAPTLMGYPVAEAEDMPDVATDSLAVAFGDFQRGYLVVDRVGIRVLRDPYSAKPYVLFYTTKRVGGGVQDFDAIKLLKFGA